MAVQPDAWTSLVGEGILLNGADPTALHRARIRARNTARQRREARHVRAVEEEALREAATPTCQLPDWLEAALSENVAGVGDVPKAPRLREWKKPSPLTDRVVLLMRDHPEWGTERLAAEARCSKALVLKTKRQLASGER